MAEAERTEKLGGNSGVAGSDESGAGASPVNGTRNQERVFRSFDNMLYLAGGSNAAASLYTDVGFRNSVDIQAWKSLLTERASSIQATGSKFAQLIVPEKLTVYPLSEHDRQVLFPGLSESDIVSPGRRLVSELDNASIFYPDEFLREQRLTMPIYLPTDSHWTWQGAFSAFQFLMWGMGYRPDYKAFVDLKKTTLKYRGDLWEPQLTDIESDPFVRIVLPSSIHRIYANPIVGFKEKLGLDDEQGLHGGSHCIFQNSHAEFEETAVIFGSSFSECRLEPSLLTSMFAFYFETVHFIWSTSVDIDYIRTNKPNITVAEVPERFLTFYPKDFCSAEEMAIDKLRNWKRPNATTAVTGSHPTQINPTDQNTKSEPRRLPFWKLEKSKISEQIASKFGILKILLKTKDDPSQVRDWVAHHANIVGRENLIIFDNMSNEPDTLAYYEDLRESIKVFSYDGFPDLIHHMDYYGELYTALRSSCDYFLFLDTDEYLALYEGGDEFIMDERITAFLTKNGSTQAFPCTWLPNLKGYKDRFQLRSDGWPLSGGLQWGKPIISATSDTCGIVHHNTQIDHKIYEASLVTNFIILHRSNVVAAERIRANLKKLIAYGTLKPGDGVEQAMALEVDSMPDGNPKTYLSEIRTNLAEKDKSCHAIDDSFQLDSRGGSVWNHHWQRDMLCKFIEKPFEFSSGLLSLPEMKI